MTTLRALIDRLLEWQIRKPVHALAVAGAVTAVFAVLASGLTLRTRYDALLPDDAPSVRELRRLETRANAAQTTLIVLEGADRAALRRMGDAIVPELLALGFREISAAEDGPHELRAYLAPRAGLFLDEATLKAIDHDIEARWDWEVGRASGYALDDDSPPPAGWEAIEQRLRAKPGDARGRDVTDRFPDGYYEREDGHALVVVAHSPIPGGDLARVGAALDHVRGVVTRVKRGAPERASIAVAYAGDMPTGFREYSVVSRDLLSVGATGIALVLAAVVLYFLRLRAVLVMAVTIAVGLTWTFGVTRLVIGHLNVATAFLVSIVAGNGINVGILYQARYFEERRRGLDPESAVRIAVQATWKPTAIAALSSAAAYGSLMITDFRAFRDFGFIAASGMLLCWVVKTLMVAPLLLLLDRRPERSRPAWLARYEMAYGRVFARLAQGSPVVFVAAGILVALLGIAGGARYVRGDPMEYDLRKTETDRSETADLHHAWAVAHEVLGSSQGALVVAADSANDAVALEDALMSRWRAAPDADKPFVAVHGLADLVAKDQERKLPILASIAARIERARARGFVPDEDWERVRPFLPRAGLETYSVEDLPASIKEPFTDARGVVGSLVLVESDPAAGDDLRALVRFADGLRETRLPDGRVVHGSGGPVILADMLRAVARDVPRSIALSFALTLLTVFVAFQRGSYLAAVLFALAVGCGGVASFLYLGDVKLNFLNFSALPITFGIGVDYAVNVAQRYEADRKRSILDVLRTSGGAVVLCSLTTMLGYLALLGSHNGAIRGLGAIAAVGEMSCLLAAVLVMPSVWWLVERGSGLFVRAPVTETLQRSSKR